MRNLKTIVALSLATAAGCGGGGGNNNNPDAAGAPDGPPAAQGTSFDNAIDITSAVDVGTGTMGTLPDTKTKIYYKATLTAGDHLVVTTASNAETTTDGSVTDTVVTAYGTDKAPFAQDDDAWPRSSTDSAMFLEVPSGGTIYITVEDCNSHSATGCYPAAGVTDLAFTLHVLHTNKLVSPEITAAAANDGTTAHADAITYKVPTGGMAGQYGTYLLDGNFAGTASKHAFAFKPPAATLDAGGRERAEFFVQPIGAANGDGSTSNIKAWVTAADGTTILASADQSNYRDGDNATNGPLDLSLPVTAGTQYYLFVQNGDATSKPSTDYYFVEHFAGQYFYGTAETEGAGASGANDSMGTAQKLATPATATAGAFFADGNIGKAGDVDWYEVDPIAGTKTVDLDCASARTGSGVVGLSATLYAADGTTVIGTIGPESATTDLLKSGVTVPANTAKAFLKVSATSLDPTNTGTSYRCSAFYATM